MWCHQCSLPPETDTDQSVRFGVGFRSVMSHAPEIVILVLVAALIFGPRRLPEIGSSLGKALKGFQRGLHGEEGPREESRR